MLEQPQAALQLFLSSMLQVSRQARLPSMLIWTALLINRAVMAVPVNGAP